MDLEVVGRHALLFDDDATAAFVNSRDALVEWNSLLIDRYDVRHLLQHPPPPLKRRRHHPSSPTSLESELDQERFLDLPPPSDDPDQPSLQESVNGTEPAVGGAYRAVSFSYGNPDVSSDQKNFDAGLGDSGFCPPFPVPESLQNLPPTEKVHQIIARTAIFVRKNGGQSEIVLRVKQGDNPTFGFLMPDHHLHAYFRFLVDHPELLSSGIDVKPQDEKKEDSGQNQTGDVAGGALSLLGSVYGSGEDEDGVLQVVSEAKEKDPAESFNAANTTISHGSEHDESNADLSGKVDAAPKHPLHAAIEKAPSLKRTRSVTAVNADATSSRKKGGYALTPLSVAVDKPQGSTQPSMSKVEPLILEPPSHLKRMVDKIVEFILKNGKEIEAELMEQDKKNGRFPFLLPSNQYHPYYLKVLQKAQESKFPGKSFAAQKHDSNGNVGDKKGNDVLFKRSSISDMPYDSQKKEKFKMVIGGPKKDAQDSLSKRTQQQSGVSVDAAAAILLAATRGLRNPKLDILSKTSMDDSGLGLSGEAGPTSSFGSLSSSRARSSTPKPVPNGEHSISMPFDLSRSVGQSDEGGRTNDVSVAKVIAKTAALAAASEADSSEACLTREQKQKAERLKRAKMFAAMIKGGMETHTKDLLPRLSAEPPDSTHSGLLGSGCKGSTLDGVTKGPDASNLSGAEVDLVNREREGSTVPLDAITSDRVVKSEKQDSDDDYKEQISRKHSSRSRKLEEDNNDDDDDGKDHKHCRKKHRSHHSSRHNRDEHKHKKRHSSHKQRESRHRHKHHCSSEDEHQHRSRSHKRHSSSEDEHQHRSRSHKHHSSSEDEHRHRSRLHKNHSSSEDEYRHRSRSHKHHSSSDDEHRHQSGSHKNHSSSEDEHQHRSRSDKHRKISHLERKVESEDEEINSKISAHSNVVGVGDNTSGEASLDLLKNDPQSGSTPSATSTRPSDTKEVSDELRAKVRAMLLATM